MCQLLAEIGPDGKERRARLLIELADATERGGDYPASMTAAREAIRIASTMKDQALRAHAQGRLAGVLSKIGAIDEALALHTEQVEIYETLGDVFSRAVTLGDIARLKAGRGEVARRCICMRSGLPSLKRWVIGMGRLTPVGWWPCCGWER